VTEGGYDGARSRVLFLSQDMLWPSVGGGRIRGVRLLLSALRLMSVDLIVVAPHADISRDRWAIPDLPGLTTNTFVDESQSGVQQLPVRSSVAAKKMVEELCGDHNRYDAVHIEGHFLWSLVPAAMRSRTVVVEQNIESQLLQQRMRLGQPLTADDVDRIRTSERLVWRSAGAVVALTPEDAAEIRRRAPDVEPHVIPNGWDHLPARPSPPADCQGRLVTPRLLFFGDYDYLPNRDAFSWLLTEIFPRIRRAVPGAELVVGGVNMTSDLEETARSCAGVEPLGYIEDLKYELDRADIVLCPLRWGGGVKVKVIEALRRSCLLVSTTTSGMGLPERLRSAVCFADDADGFADHVVHLCNEPMERRWRRARLAASRSLQPTWEASSARTMSLWSAVSNRAGQHKSGGEVRGAHY
jgi:glycosyltransferase involved in cell wall biosynthesis